MSKRTLYQVITAGILFFILLLFGVACQKFVYDFTPDSLTEEIIEEVIEANTGVCLDLSPGTPE